MADENIVYKIEIDDSQAGKAANNIANNLGKVDAAAKKSKGSFAEFGGAIEAAIPGVGKLNAAFKLLVANPVGAAIAAIAAAIGIVTAALKRSEPVMDFFENILNAISVTADVLLDNLKEVGMILLNLATFNFTAAADGVKNLTKQIKDAVVAGQMYLDILRDLEDAMFNFRLATADEEAQIKTLLVQLKDKNLTYNQQLEILDKLLKKEKDLSNARADFARIQAVAEIKQIANSRNLRQTDDEMFDAFVKRVISSGKFAGEEGDKMKERIVELYEKMKQAGSESKAFEAELAVKRSEFTQRHIEEMQKEAEAAYELAKYIDGIRQNSIQSQYEQLRTDEAARESRLRGLKKYTETEFKLSVDSATSMAKAKEKINKKVVADQQATNDLIFESQLGTVRALGNLLGVFGRKNKAFASAQAVINTYLGVTEILKAPATPFVEPFATITRFLQIATVIASGTQAVRQINSAPAFARGGISGRRINGSHGIPISRDNGDNLLATVRTGEVILNERQQAALGGPATFKRIGVPGFADGGFVSAPLETRYISAQINSDRLISELSNTLLNMPRNILVLEDFEAVSGRKAEVREAATI